MIDLDAFGDKTPRELCREAAQRELQQRKVRKLSRAALSAKSGVPASTIRRFENTGDISFHSLAALAKALGYSQDIQNLFSKRHFASIQEVIDAKDY